MRKARLPFIALALAAAVLVAPSAVLAAEPVSLTGTVVRDGLPVTGAEVVVTVTGSDVIASAATDENGAFTVEVDGEVGTGLRIFATGRTSRTGPDARGCVRSETPIGQLDAVIEALPPAPLTVDLATVLSSEVCGATGTPPGQSTPRVTPPSTDLGPAGPAGGSGSGLPLVLGLLALAGAGALSLAHRRP